MILIWSRVCYLALSSWSEGILFVFPRIQPCTSYIPDTQYIICWINECVVAGTLFDSVTTHVGCADVSWHRIFLDLAQQGHLKAWRYSMKKKKNWRRGISGCWGMRERDQGLAGEDTLLLWRKLPMREPSRLEESHELMEGPMWERGSGGYQPTQISPAVLPLPPSLPQTWRSQKPNRK